MKGSTGVKMLELQEEGLGGRTFLHPALIWDAEGAVLVDTGMPGSWERIRAEILAAGVSLDQLKAVILTHQDFDHIGSLPDILQELGGRIQVYAHALDQPYIEGELPLIKTTPSKMAPMLAALPEAERQKVLDLFGNPPKAKVDQTLADGDVFPCFGGIQVIHTPGHTPGHISLYVKGNKTLIAGDAMVCAEGILHGPVARATLDMDEALCSVKKFLDFEIESAICYHGGRCDQNVREQIEQLVEPESK
ncbi:MBL fold metallo-hydrolase [Brevibacillus ruminantium]|uniref:MBL fold metallo-hydrolase n=1 Tax=Brevibacillus ruminantium TaxID=2950604 RepID=A0ABY4WEM7_9BACL|nr:MBL fold metallo-hydrolase [Brevibacillus ruminantium]USG65615.1 MBL fold metallo-hydrolase [Brevibacillus ruminantium]